MVRVSCPESLSKIKVDPDACNRVSEASKTRYKHCARLSIKKREVV